MKAYWKQYKWMLGLLAVLVVLSFFYVKRYSTKSYPIVLTYHSIQEEPTSEYSYLFVRPSELEKQLQLLNQKGYVFCFASEYADSDRHQIILTLDDGYEDNYTNLFPLLKKYNAKATIFVVADTIGTPNHLTEAEIREMSESGLVEFGSHTQSHPRLSTLDDAALAQELEGSKARLEEICGKPVTTLAYPYSDFDQRVMQAASKYYRFAYIDWQRDYYAPYELSRNSVHRDTTLEEFEQLLR